MTGFLRGRTPYLLMLVGPILLFSRLLFRGEVLFWGTPQLQFVPWRSLALETLLAGHLPLWNPLLGMGAPLLANYQSGLLYPPNWLLILTGPGWGQGLLVVLHLVWSGWGMLALTRRLGLSPAAGTIAGLAYSLSGYLISRAGFLSINAAVAWLPWLIAWVEDLVLAVEMRQSRARVGLATLRLASGFGLQWLAGHAQMAWYSLVMVSAWSLWRLFAQHGWSTRRRVLKLLAAAMVLAFCLAAAQILPTAEYQQQSRRAEGLETEFALVYSLSPLRLLGLLLPDLVGNPAQGNFSGYGNFWEDAIYLGVLPFLLALLAIAEGLRGRRGFRALSSFLAVCSIVAVVLALGSNTPLYRLLFRFVPTFDLFQAPARWSLLLVFSLSLLAAIGFDAWAPAAGRMLYWVRLGTAASGGMVITAWLARGAMPEVASSIVASFSRLGMLLLLAGLTWLLMARQAGWRRWAWLTAVTGLVLTDLVLAGWGLNPSQPANLYRRQSELVKTVGQEHRLYMPAPIEYFLKFEYSHRFDTFDPGLAWSEVRDMGLPNTTMLDGLRSANNFDPLLPDRFVTWMEALERLPEAQELRLLRLMDAGWIAEMQAGEPGSLRYRALPGASRLRLVSEAIWVDGAERALEQVLASSFDPDRLVILEGGQEAASRPPRDPSGQISIVPTSNPNLVTIEARSQAEAWLVLSDSWYPGWRAFIDGEQTEVFKADYLFMAVRLPKGAHRVEFRFHSPPFLAGGAMSVAGWLLLCILGLRWGAIRRQEQRD